MASVTTCSFELLGSLIGVSQIAQFEFVFMVEIHSITRHIIMLKLKPR